MQQPPSTLRKQPPQREQMSKIGFGNLTAEKANIDIDSYMPKLSLLTAEDRHSVATAFDLDRDQSGWRPKLTRPMTAPSFLAGSSSTTTLVAPPQLTESYQSNLPSSSTPLTTGEEPNRNSFYVGKFLLCST